LSPVDDPLTEPETVCAEAGTDRRKKGVIMTIDQDKLGELLGRFVTDLGATVAAGSVVVGHRLGLYRSLAEGPATPEELARRTGTDSRYVAEWLGGPRAGTSATTLPPGGSR
jgi:hypothetical protein